MQQEFWYWMHRHIPDWQKMGGWKDTGLYKYRSDFDPDYKTARSDSHWSAVQKENH